MLGRTHAQEMHVGLGQRRIVGGPTQPTGGHHFSQQLVKTRFEERRPARGQSGDSVCIDIHGHHVEPQ